ncbi:hypothetical protein BD769DRAFT_1519214 [Suillus cothurnatus]|nr:hypothetical protein BD769DRAFT_1519214 [Suillus cothurnatus]
MSSMHQYLYPLSRCTRSQSLLAVLIVLLPINESTLNQSAVPLEIIINEDFIRHRFEDFLAIRYIISPRAPNPDFNSRRVMNACSASIRPPSSFPRIFPA